MRTRSICLLASSLLVACPSTKNASDGGVQDAVPGDAGTSDAGLTDGGGGRDASTGLEFRPPADDPHRDRPELPGRRGARHLRQPTHLRQFSADISYAQGYMVAHDRLIQLDFERHSADGTLSYLIGGASPPVVAQDVQMRIHHLRDQAQATYSALQASTDPHRPTAEGGARFVRRRRQRLLGRFERRRLLPAAGLRHGLPAGELRALDQRRLGPAGGAARVPAGLRRLRRHHEQRAALRGCEPLRQLHESGAGGPGRHRRGPPGDRARRFHHDHLRLDGLQRGHHHGHPGSPAPAAATHARQGRCPVRTAAPVGGRRSESARQPSDRGPRPPARIEQLDLSGPQLSATGNAMVANDTHLSIHSPATFWIHHLVNLGSDQPLNVMGEQLPGVRWSLGMNQPHRLGR